MHTRLTLGILDRQIDRVLGDPSGGVLRRFPGQMGALRSLGDLDRARCSRESRQTRLEGGDFGPGPPATSVDARHAELVGGARLQFRLAQEADLTRVHAHVELIVLLERSDQYRSDR